MGLEYAVLDENRAVVYQSEGFDPAAVRQELPLSRGGTLCIGGEDPLAAENRELARKLEAANAANIAKETFLSNMSHDIRTPMNAIVGMAALAKKHIDEKSRVADALGKIEIASGHLLSLINDVLDMSRINSGRMQLMNEPFFLSDLLHDIMTILRPQLEQKGHAWRLEAGDIAVEGLRGDALRLRQVYVNIVNNAVKYTPDGGSIVLRVWETMADGRCCLHFQCSDNGIGMSREFLERIYEPFERVNSSTISRIEGTGLGMSIVKKTVEAMGGAIAIESAPGEGTTVSVDVPLDYERITVNTSALEGKRLLILEADEKLPAVYRQYLGEFSIAHSIADSMTDALNLLTEADFRGEKYDAVIIGKEQKNSHSVFDIAQYLSKSYPSLTLVLVSDIVWEEVEYLANRSGIHSFIPLPFFRKSLINGLNQALLGTDGESAGSYPDLSGRTILLVEDNMINREIARELLSVTNAAVETAEDGQQAVEAYLGAPEGRYDLILMDVQMPVMDGYAATRSIRESGRADARTIPIYAMTANTFAEDIARAREAGMDGHFSKPIDIAALMQTLRRVLR